MTKVQVDNLGPFFGRRQEPVFRAILNELSLCFTENNY